MCGHGGYVHDLAATVVGHRRNERGGEEERALHVRLDQGVEAPLLQALARSEAEHARVVHEDVDAPERSLSLLRERASARHRRDVARYELCGTACSAYRVHHLAATGFVTPAHHNLGALGGERLGDGPSDARRAARY